jgi:hypothetical protein
MIYYFYNTKYVVTEIYYTKPTEDKLKEPHIVSELSFSNKYGYTLKLSVDIVQNKINAIYEKIETEEEKIYDKISILEAKNKRLEEGLQAVLSGDMQSLAYILYPEDFADINNTTLEL